jgi:hypothetical protein
MAANTWCLAHASSVRVENDVCQPVFSKQCFTLYNSNLPPYPPLRVRTNGQIYFNDYEGLQSTEFIHFSHVLFCRGVHLFCIPLLPCPNRKGSEGRTQPRRRQ